MTSRTFTRTFLGILAIVAASAAFAQTCPQTITWDNCNISDLNNITPLPGDTGNYGYVYTKTVWSMVKSVSPGCCGNITYPSCTQPVATQTLSDTETATIDISQTQSFDAALGMDSLFQYLKSPVWKITTGTSYTSHTSTPWSVTQTVSCGQMVQVWKSTTTTVGHETRTDGNNKQYSRDENNSNVSFLVTPVMGTNDTYNPCNNTVVAGNKCPPVSVDLRCAKVAGGLGS